MSNYEDQFSIEELRNINRINYRICKTINKLKISHHGRKERN